MARMNKAHMASVLIALFSNNSERQNFKIPSNDVKHNPRNNKRTKSKKQGGKR